MTTGSTAEVEVARSITVPLGQAKAFDLFTARMTEFWPPEHSIGASPFEAVVLERRGGGPPVGGRAGGKEGGRGGGGGLGAARGGGGVGGGSRGGEGGTRRVTGG